MSNAWSPLTVRFHPDQVAKFQELYPEKQFAPVMRMLLDTFLDGKKPTAKRLSEVQRLRDKLSKQLIMLEQEEKELIKDEHAKIISESVENHRHQYLESHPEIVIDFKKHGVIGAKGYRKLQLELKCSNKKQVDDIIKQFILMNPEGKNEDRV